MNQAAIEVPAPPWDAPAMPAPPPTLSRLASDVLERCRGEGPANCVARCPLGVDARGYVQLARQGRYGEALQRVREKLPFPGILGYVCAHPCEQHCKRIDEDSPVRIRDIKRFVAEWETGPPQHLLDCEPDRPERIAIVGAGPAGLLAAHDLRKRGYGVTIFERGDRIGGCLTHQIPTWRLPGRAVERDLSIIAALGIEVRTNFDVGSRCTIDDLRGDHQAVLLLTGYEGAVSLLQRGHGLHPSVRETIRVDPLTGETGVDGVFAGGDAVSGPSTVIHALAQGRRVAESVHRFLSGGDLREGRDGLLESRLLWGLEVSDLERRRRARTPVMLEPFNAPLEEGEARSEAERCLDCTCGLCVQDCEFLATHCRSPKDLARRILAGLEPLDTRRVAYSCNICELCATVCPERLDTGRLMLEARRDSVRRGLGPLPQHKPIVGYWKAGVSGAFTLAMAEPGRRRSRAAVLHGVRAAGGGSGPDVARAYDELRRQYPGTGVLMWCCGAPAELIGMEEAVRRPHSTSSAARPTKLGAEELITACPDCTHTLKGRRCRAWRSPRSGSGSPGDGRRR
jgi:glutamate synthase (NADPH) small chain